jgi:hypothetical protein
MGVKAGGKVMKKKSFLIPKILGILFAVSVMAACPELPDLEIKTVDLTNLTPPVAGEDAPPNLEIKESLLSYSIGEIKWYDSTNLDEEIGSFLEGITYIAKFTLTAREGFIFNENVRFNINKGKPKGIPSNDNKSVFVTVTFEYVQLTKIGKDGTLDLSYLIAFPFTGVFPSETIDHRQFSGVIEWKDQHGKNGVGPKGFEKLTEYTATATLTANPGYTFGTSSTDFTTLKYERSNDKDEKNPFKPRKIEPSPVVFGKKVTVTLTFPITEDEPGRGLDYIAVANGENGVTTSSHIFLFFEKPVENGIVRDMITISSSGGRAELRNNSIDIRDSRKTWIIPITVETAGLVKFQIKRNDSVTSTEKTVMVHMGGADNKLTLKTINAGDLRITPPALNQPPDSTVNGGTGYSGGTIEWRDIDNSRPHTGLFVAGVRYSASFYLYVRDDYTFINYTDIWKVTGSASVTPNLTPSIEGVSFFGSILQITVVFPETTGGSNAAAPVITTQPIGKTYIEGDIADPLTVVVETPSDGGTLSYQWHSNGDGGNAGGTPVGTNSASYTPPVATVGTTYYFVRVTNTKDGKTASVASTAVAIIVNRGSVPYTVTFNSNFPAWATGTPASPATATVTPPATTVVLPTTPPAYPAGWNAGVSFGGWYTAKTGGTQFTGTSVTSNMEVFARWNFTAGTAQVVGDTMEHIAPLMTTGGGAQGTFDGTVNTDGSVTFSGGAVRYMFPANYNNYDFVTLDYIQDGGLHVILKQGDTGTDYKPGEDSDGNQYPYLSPTGSFLFRINSTNPGIAFQCNDDTTGTIKWTKATFTKAPATEITYSVSADGAANTTTSTQLTFNFNTDPGTGLAATDINITAGTGAATRGTLTGTGLTRYLTVTGVSQGTVTVTITYTGVETTPKTNVQVYKAKTLTGISITGPTKKDYVVGETLNLAGLAVTANYSDSSTEPVTTGYTVTPAADTTLALSHDGTTVTVSYSGQTATFTITDADKTLTGITITGPTKKAYFVGDQLNLAGLAVTANYSNAPSEPVTTGYTVTPADGTVLALSHHLSTVTVSYSGQTATFTITVTEPPPGGGVNVILNFKERDETVEFINVSQVAGSITVTVNGSYTSVYGWVIDGGTVEPDSAATRTISFSTLKTPLSGPHKITVIVLGEGSMYYSLTLPFNVQ